MATQTWILVGTVIVGLMGTARFSSGQTLERFSFSEPHLGTIIDLTLYASEESVANEAARAAFARVKELDRIFSDYKPDSEVSRLCDVAGSGNPVKVSPELFLLLKQSIEISEQTDGAFDVTVGPLVQLWRRARKNKVLPGTDDINAAKALVGWRQVTLNETEKTVYLERSGMRLDFGGIAKGFIAQEVSRLLSRRGIEQSLVAVAGDIVAGAPPPEATSWKIGIAPLDRPNGKVSRHLLLKNCAVSTSGDAFQFVEIAGIRYSHIVDPKTGLGLVHRSSVTVVSHNGTTSDALATAICILGPERGLKLIEANQGTDALIVMASDEGTRVLESPAFKRHESH